jgi:hypothetical protein
MPSSCVEDSQLQRCWPEIMPYMNQRRRAGLAARLGSAIPHQQQQQREPGPFYVRTAHAFSPANNDREDRVPRIEVEQFRQDKADNRQRLPLQDLLWGRLNGNSSALAAVRRIRTGAASCPPRQSKFARPSRGSTFVLYEWLHMRRGPRYGRADSHSAQPKQPLREWRD